MRYGGNKFGPTENRQRPMSHDTRSINEIEASINEQTVGLANGRVICHGCGEENEWHPNDVPRTVTVYVEGSPSMSYRVRALYCDQCDVRTFRTQTFDATTETRGDANTPEMKHDRDQLLAAATLGAHNGNSMIVGPRVIERAAPSEPPTPVESNFDEYAQ